MLPRFGIGDSVCGRGRWWQCDGDGCCCDFLCRRAVVLVYRAVVLALLHCHWASCPLPGHQRPTRSLLRQWLILLLLHNWLRLPLLRLLLLPHCMPYPLRLPVALPALEAFGLGSHRHAGVDGWCPLCHRPGRLFLLRDGFRWLGQELQDLLQLVVFCVRKAVLYGLQLVSSSLVVVLCIPLNIA